LKNVLGLGIDIIHISLNPAEKRLRAQHVNRNLAPLGQFDRFLKPVLIITDLIGDHDDHRVVDLPRRILVVAPAADDLRNGCEGGLHTCLISGYFSHRLEDLRQLSGGFGCHRLTVLAKGDHEGQKPLVGREVVLVELGDMGVDCLDVLTQPLSLGLQAAGGVKCPDDEGSPLFQPVEDLDGDAIHRSFDTSNMLCSVSLDRHGLAHHSCSRQDNLRGPADVQSGKLRGNGACCLCRVRSYWNGTRRAWYRGDRRRQVRRERPRRGVSDGGSALWSRS